MGIRVKICGVTDRDGATAAVVAGADCVGFVFAESERRVTPEVAAGIAGVLPDGVRRVAVFRHPTGRDLREVMMGFSPDIIQSEPDPAVFGFLGKRRLLPVFHDSEDLVERVGAYRVSDPSGLVLLEGVGRGGRGTKANWDRAREVALLGPLALAGGLTPDNVADAIRRVRPFAVDVSSGVESAPGIKDPSKVTAFIQAVREAEAERIEKADEETVVP